MAIRQMADLGFAVLSREEQPTRADIAKAQKVAWTMALEPQPLSDEGFQRLLRKVVARRQARSAA
jgi:hypothetical protein